MKKHFDLFIFFKQKKGYRGISWCRTIIMYNKKEVQKVRGTNRKNKNPKQKQERKDPQKS